MTSKYNAIYGALLDLVPELLDLRPGDYRRYSAAGFMDLHLDVLSFLKTGGETLMVIALAHNYRHPSGDLVPDPDMEIRIRPDHKSAEALAYQDMYSYRVVYDAAGIADAKEQAGQNDFLLTWLMNIRAQGFALAEQHGDDK